MPRRFRFRMDARTEMPDAIPTLILCGGFGTRLREETEYRPKPMVEIGGRPILWHIMKIYAAHGFTDFILLIVYRGERIREYFVNDGAEHSACTVIECRREVRCLVTEM